MAAMVGEEEGPKTEFLGGMLPPRFDERSKPSLSVEEKFNKTVVFQLPVKHPRHKPEMSGREIIKTLL